MLVTAVQFLQPQKYLVCRAGRDTQFPVVPALTDNVPPVDSQAPAGKVYLEFRAALDGADGLPVNILHCISVCLLIALEPPARGFIFSMNTVLQSVLNQVIAWFTDHD